MWGSYETYINQTRGLFDERYSHLLLTTLNQSQVAVSYKKVHVHVEDGNPVTTHIHTYMCATSNTTLPHDFRLRTVPYV